MMLPYCLLMQMFWCMAAFGCNDLPVLKLREEKKCGLLCDVVFDDSVFIPCTESLWGVWFAWPNISYFEPRGKGLKSYFFYLQGPLKLSSDIHFPYCCAPRHGNVEVILDAMRKRFHPKVCIVHRTNEERTFFAQNHNDLDEYLQRVHDVDIDTLKRLTQLLSMRAKLISIQSREWSYVIRRSRLMRSPDLSVAQLGRVITKIYESLLADPWNVVQFSLSNDVIDQFFAAYKRSQLPELCSRTIPGVVSVRIYE